MNRKDRDEIDLDIKRMACIKKGTWKKKFYEEGTDFDFF